MGSEHHTELKTVSNLSGLIFSLVPAKLTYEFSEQNRYPLSEIKKMMGNRYDPALSTTKQLEEYGIKVNIDINNRVFTLTRTPPLNP